MPRMDDLPASGDSLRTQGFAPSELHWINARAGRDYEDGSMAPGIFSVVLPCGLDGQSSRRFCVIQCMQVRSQ